MINYIFVNVYDYILILITKKIKLTHDISLT